MQGEGEKVQWLSLLISKEATPCWWSLVVRIERQLGEVLTQNGSRAPFLLCCVKKKGVARVWNR